MLMILWFCDLQQSQHCTLDIHYSPLGVPGNALVFCSRWKDEGGLVKDYSYAWHGKRYLPVGTLLIQQTSAIQNIILRNTFYLILIYLPGILLFMGAIYLAPD